MTQVALHLRTVGGTAKVMSLCSMRFRGRRVGGKAMLSRWFCIDDQQLLQLPSGISVVSGRRKVYCEAVERETLRIEEAEKNLGYAWCKFINDDDGDASEIKTDKAILMIKQLATKLGLENSVAAFLGPAARKPKQEWSELEQSAARILNEALGNHLTELETIAAEQSGDKSHAGEVTESGGEAQQEDMIGVVGENGCNEPSGDNSHEGGLAELVGETQRDEANAAGEHVCEEHNGDMSSACEAAAPTMAESEGSPPPGISATLQALLPLGRGRQQTFGEDTWPSKFSAMVKEMDGIDAKDLHPHEHTLLAYKVISTTLDLDRKKAMEAFDGKTKKEPGTVWKNVRSWLATQKHSSQSENLRRLRSLWQDDVAAVGAGETQDEEMASSVGELAAQEPVERSAKRRRTAWLVVD